MFFFSFHTKRLPLFFVISVCVESTLASYNLRLWRVDRLGSLVLDRDSYAS